LARPPGYGVLMHPVAIFFWGGFFATVVLMLAGALAAFVKSHHRVALAAALTAMLSGLFIATYLVGLPIQDRGLEIRLIAHVGLVAATLLQLMLMVDLGLLRDRETGRRILAGLLALLVVTVGVSWMLTPRQAMLLGSSVSFAVSIGALLTAANGVWHGDRNAWPVLWGTLLLPACVAGVSWIALDPLAVPWRVHAVSALAGTAFVTGVGAMLWLRYSYLIELREVLAQGPRYDPITRMRTHAATAQMLGQTFMRQQGSTRPVLLIAVSIGNLYALENLHGRAALNHALFVCASRVRRSVPAGMEVGRLFDDSFLVVSRDARNLDQLMKVGRRLAARLARPVTLHTSSGGDEVENQRTQWAAQVGVGLLATTAQAQPGAVVGKVRDMARTAWSFASRIAWLDQTSDTISELPALDSVQ
jgi:GGDEF domain-containing protein